MKAALLIFAVAGSMANAATLKCWNTYSSSRTPVLEAQIVANDKLSNVKVKNENIDDTNRLVDGKLITTGRSPYKGNNAFILENAKLILPVSLKNDDLKTVQLAGEKGFVKGENGVVIGSFRDGGDGAGNHLSIRLRCRSYAR